MLTARLTCWIARSTQPPSGRSSGVEHNLAKVGVEGSNPFARSSFLHIFQYLRWTRSPLIVLILR